MNAEQPPKLSFPVVAIGASAGGLEAFSTFLTTMRPDSGMAFVLIQHLPPNSESMMAEILGRRTKMSVQQVEDGMAIRPNHVYVIQPGRVLTMQDGLLRLGPPLGSPRAANRPIDDFFKSLAEEQRERAICVILSGMGSNGAAGAQVVKAVGGLCVAQDPETAEFPSMPRHLIDAGYADFILPPTDIPDVLLNFAGSPYARGTSQNEAEALLQREQQHLREILAVLRTRTKRDFTGYKKPTVLRRAQRRMGLLRVGSLADYGRFLRQSPSEVIALADDLLIHVSGFFRDPDAWDALREQVIVPLVAARESGGSVRAWVAACSSGEEAYTLTMLLMEESESVGKRLDVKVFATDLADRSLANARAGIYPGGIESEVTPERLTRFFTKEDELYRIRPEVRDRVVFAPQNVLQDPPFSRLDIVTCRNLLIYLEPDVQQRVLTLLHFGLREGGALFLGTAESVLGAEDLFEPVDRKARIYRRVGQTRHGNIEFPMPRELSAALGTRSHFRPSERTRQSIAQLTRRSLVHSELPAVTIDRECRIAFFHGNTKNYILQPAGEPTRDLFALTPEEIRGAVRIAVNRAAAANAPATEIAGWFNPETSRRVRVAITASPAREDPMGDEPAPPDYFVVSFAEAGETPAVAEPMAANEYASQEIQRLRFELQSAMEELQTSTEEMKAANEEVISINEELQSANEELETSKEEMQSLNEELSTVNAELRVKVEEHQTASSDLLSLLASANIAVLFLDTAFRIRRFTPAARDLVDLIAADVGRPLAALARNFDDPQLIDDSAAVLERLVPMEQEVAGGDSRHYLRRIHPYRTIENRIEGVVISFVDITARKLAEEAIRASEEQFRRSIEDAPIPVIMQAEDGKVLQISRTWTELTGYSLEDVPTAEAWLTRAYGSGADAVRLHMQDLFKGSRKTLNVEFAIRTRFDDERMWSFSASAPGSLRDGRRFLVGMAVDVTERRRIEERQRRMLNIDVVGVLVFDANGTVIEANDAFLTMSGYSRDDVASGTMNWRRLTPPEAIEESERQLRLLETNGRIGPYEKEYFHKDGRRLWMLFAGAALGDGTIFEYAIDIGPRKAAEAALRTSEERLQSIVQSATDYAIITLDPEGLVTSWNSGAEAIFGWTATEMIGGAAERVFTPEDRAAGAAKAELTAARQFGRAEDERWHLRKDGSRFYASGVINRLSVDELGFVKVLRDLTTMKNIQEQLRLSHEELENRVEERTAELRASQSRALKAERLAAIGEMITGLAHESRNALQRGQACLSMLAARLASDHEALDLVNRAQHAQDDLHRLYEDVREYAAPYTLERTSCDVLQLVRKAWDEMSGVRTGRQTELIEEVQCSDWDCFGSEFHLRQVFRNVFDNALSAATDPVQIRVRFSQGELEGRHAICIRVQDNGGGFSPEAKEYAFEAFYTTKSHGTGLGLAICRRIVAAHGGRIEIDVRSESGGCIVILLPRESYES